MLLPNQRTAIFILVGFLFPLLLITTFSLIRTYTLPYITADIPSNTSMDNLQFKVLLGSKMPNPCATRRRKTGVEDLLCMESPNFLKEYKNPCWTDNRTFRCLPYFYLIGNAKCGTTDFFRRLNLHPDILPNKGNFQKETSFWSRERLRPRKTRNMLVPRITFKQFTNYFRGQDIRRSAAINGYHYKVTCLGDPMDFYDRFDEENLPQNTPGKEELLWTTPFVVKHVQPDIKLLLILRDPIDRLYSHYFHGNFGTSPYTFHYHVVKSINVLNDCFFNHSVRHCLYSKTIMKKLKTPIYASFDIVHLKEWTRAFPLKQILIFRNEDYAKDIRGTLIRVFNFVNISIPNETVLQRMSASPHYRETVGKKKAGPMLPETKTLLKSIFQPYVNELAIFLRDDRYLFRDSNFH